MTHMQVGAACVVCRKLRFEAEGSFFFFFFFFHSAHHEAVGSVHVCDGVFFVPISGRYRMRI